MSHVFVSGCYDILHAGHVQFFTEARALGDRLTVCFASSRVLWDYKRRRSSMPDEHKKVLIESLAMVDDVVIGNAEDYRLDFADHFLRLRPDILAVTDDDQVAAEKRELCVRIGADYRVLPKTPPTFEPTSTSAIVKFIRAPAEAPLRIDFAGGWLDVPRLARPGEYVVNCSISPLVSLREWDYERCSGLGGSGAYAVLSGSDGVAAELKLGVGWQDPAVISETGLCVWRSGERPSLEMKRDGAMLAGRMAVAWTGKPHDTPGSIDLARDYDLIANASRVAREAVLHGDVTRLGEAITMSYRAQLGEGMDQLPEANGAIARKYCGGGWGGYAMYLFDGVESRDRFCQRPNTKVIEPYCLRS